MGLIGPALLFCFYGLLGLSAAVLTPETWSPAERAEVERIGRPVRTPAAAPEPVAAVAAAV